MKHFTEIIDTKLGDQPSYCAFSGMSVIRKKAKCEFRNFDAHLSDELQQELIDSSGVDNDGD